MNNGKKLRKEIDELRKTLLECEKPVGHSSNDRMMAQCARLNALTAELAEISTRRIVWLTWGLIILTFALLAVEIRAVFFPKNLTANPQITQTGQYDDVVRPSLTKGQNP